MVRTKTSTNTKALPPPPPKDQVDMDYEELIKQLEEENNRLKRLVADQALDIQILKDINSKKW